MHTVPDTRASAQPDAPLRLLLLDRARPNWRLTLNGWIGEDGTARLLALGQQRYVLVSTLDTRSGDPRYLHLAELLGDLDALIARVMGVVISTERLALPGSGIDLRFGLEPGERDRINAVLDAHEAERLLRAPAGGSA